MSLPSDTPFSSETYNIYANHLVELLFPGEDLIYILRRAETHHQANRLIMHVIIQDSGPERLLEMYSEYTSVILNNWKTIRKTVLIQKKQFAFGEQIAVHLNLQNIYTENTEPLTFEHRTVWKDLCSYRNWTWKESR